MRFWRLCALQSRFLYIIIYLSITQNNVPIQFISMIVVPKAFIDAGKHNNDGNIKILIGGWNNVVLKKTLTTKVTNNARFVSCHAFTLVHAGCLLVKSERFTSERINSGEMVFLPKGLYMLSDLIPDDKPFQATVLFFEESLLIELLSESIQKPQSASSQSALWHHKQPNSIQVFISQLDDLYGESSSSNHQIVVHKLAEFLHLLLDSEVGASIKKYISNNLQREKVNINKFMARNFDKPLQIKDYAYLTGRSVASFHRDFKRVYHIAPKQWLIKQRLSKAKEAIQAQKSTNISQIAFDVGYENTSNFIKAFHRRFGLSPKQYQMSCRSQLKIE